jgi:zinc transport system substrate-binding protein
MAAGLAGCGRDSTPAAVTGGNEQIKVVATFYPLYEFTARVGGDGVAVESFTPTGVEPHEWEPTPRDMARLTEADLIVYNGAGFEPWLDKQIPDLAAGGVKVLEATGGMDLIKEKPGYLGAGNPEHHHDSGHGHSHDHAFIDGDPHFWLDPILVMAVVDAIRDALTDLDPAGAAAYSANAASFRAELEALDAEYRAAAGTWQRREIVTSHDAFAYLARRYNLRQAPVLGLSPEAEPSPARMKEIVDFAREHDVKYIFFETLVSPRLAEAVAREAGAGVLVLHTLENLTAEELAAGENYLTIMRSNLANLEKALGEAK